MGLTKNQRRDRDHIVEQLEHAGRVIGHIQRQLGSYVGQLQYRASQLDEAKRDSQDIQSYAAQSLEATEILKAVQDSLDTAKSKF